MQGIMNLFKAGPTASTQASSSSSSSSSFSTSSSAPPAHTAAETKLLLQTTEVPLRSNFSPKLLAAPTTLTSTVALVATTHTLAPRPDTTATAHSRQPTPAARKSFHLHIKDISVSTKIPIHRFMDITPPYPHPSPAQPPPPARNPPSALTVDNTYPLTLTLPATKTAEKKFVTLRFSTAEVLQKWHFALCGAVAEVIMADALELDASEQLSIAKVCP